jgi:hypothetical protein
MGGMETGTAQQPAQKIIAYGHNASTFPNPGAIINLSKRVSQKIDCDTITPDTRYTGIPTLSSCRVEVLHMAILRYGTR